MNTTEARFCANQDVTYANWEMSPQGAGDASLDANVTLHTQSAHFAPSISSSGKKEPFMEIIAPNGCSWGVSASLIFSFMSITVNVSYTGFKTIPFLKNNLLFP